MATLLTGDTPQPLVTPRMVPGTTDLLLIVVTSRQTNEQFGSFERIVSPERRVPLTLFGIETDFETTERAKHETLDVAVTVERGWVYFDPRALAAEYGREIEGVTAPRQSTAPELVPLTPEERRLVHNLREIGATFHQIIAAQQNHRSGGDQDVLEAELLSRGATFHEIEAILGAVRRARRHAGDDAGPLTPSGLDEIFSGMEGAAPSSLVNADNEHWDLLPESAIENDQATLVVARDIIAEIHALDSTYTPPELQRVGDFPTTVQMRSDYLNRLRFERAATIARVRDDHGPLQVETLRLMQIEADLAYAAGLVEAQLGRLTVRLSEGEALGNYVDGWVRDEGRNRFDSVGIDWARDQYVRIQRREYDTSGADATYRVPDIAIADMMFDATITRKLPGRAQIRGYFASDSMPRGVIVVRPTALGGSYLITPPNTRDREVIK